MTTIIESHVWRLTKIWFLSHIVNSQHWMILKPETSYVLTINTLRLRIISEFFLFKNFSNPYFQLIVLVYLLIHHPAAFISDKPAVQHQTTLNSKIQRTLYL